MSVCQAHLHPAAVAANLRRAGRPLSFKLAVLATWEQHANGPAYKLATADVPFHAPLVPVGGVFKFGWHTATRLQLPGHYRQAPRAAF